MKKVKVFLAALLAVTVLFGGATPAHAKSAVVDITVEATDMSVSVTVPSTIPIVFNEDGTNTYPSNWVIENNSNIAGIYLDDVAFTAKNGWSLLGLDEDAKALPVGTKQVKFFMGTEEIFNHVTPAGLSGGGGVSFEPTDIQLPARTSQKMEFEVERGAFTEAITAERAFELVFTFQFS